MKRHVLTALLLCVALCLPALAMAEGDTRQKIDVVFLIDTTGSMSNNIENAKQQLMTINNTLSGQDVRYALVAFGDHRKDEIPTEYTTTNGTMWTSDVDELMNTGFSNLQGFHGGDTEETSTNSIRDVVYNMISSINAWRDQALRVIILVTDADPVAPGKYNVEGKPDTYKLTIISIDDAIKACERESVCVILADYGNTTQYSDLVSKTGGMIHSVNNSPSMEPIAQWINDTPWISGQPSDYIQEEGKDVILKVTTDDANATYQWQKCISNGNGIYTWQSISGETGSTLTLRSVSRKEDGARYRCSVKYSNDELHISNPARLSIPYAPLFTIDPRSISVDAGAQVQFAVYSLGEGITYQWQKPNGTVWENMTIDGSTSDRIKLSNVQAKDDQSQYRCVATSKFGTQATSRTATLTVFDITTQPESTKSAEVGATVTLSVAASGDVKSYQWEKEVNGSWTEISGATGATLQLSNVMGSDAGSYRCVITSERNTTATSNAAVLTVLPALAFTTNPTDALVESGKTASFAVQAAGDGVTYQWQRKKPGGDWTDMTGKAGATLELGAVSEGDDGSLFRCVATSSLGTVKTSTEAKLTVVSAPAITLQPQSLRVAEGQDASFTIEATGYDLHYQWQVRTENGFADCPDGQTDTLTLKARKLADDGSVYRCVVHSGFGTELTSDEVTLTVVELPDLPETGDSSRLGLWAALCAACVLGLAALKRRA